MAKAPAAKGSKKRPVGATRRAPPPPAARSAAPNWQWLLGGLVLAGFVGGLIYLNAFRDEAETPVAATPADATQPAAAAQPAATPGSAAAKPASARPATSAPATDEQRFEFYTLLPNQDVMPTTKSVDTANDPRTALKTAPKPTKPEAATAALPRFLLQAGAFRAEAEADRRRAELLLLGLPARVQAGGDGWFRVMVGPLQGEAARDRTQGLLKANNIATLSVKAD